MKVVWLMVPLLHFTYVFTALWTWSIQTYIELIAQLIPGVFCNCMVFVNSSCPTQDSSFFFSFCLSPPASPILHCWQVGSTTSSFFFSLQLLQMTSTQKVQTQRKIQIHGVVLKIWEEHTTYYHFIPIPPNENILNTNKKNKHSCPEQFFKTRSKSICSLFCTNSFSCSHVKLQFNQTKRKTQTYIHIKKEKTKNKDKSSKTNTNPYIPYYFPTLSIHLV